MTLRRKLLTTFGVLALLGLVVASVSIWATIRWEQTNEDLENHYTRSLEVQRIRATTFEAFKEVPDSLGENDPDARQEFERALDPAKQDFELWRSLAETEEERRQVRQVRDTYDTLVGDARVFFDLMDDGRRAEAARLADGKIEEADFENFQAATREAVNSDRALRDDVRARVENSRRTAQLVLIVAAFGTVSLLFLLGAYLASDLFRPMREVERALGGVEKGDFDRRLDEERADELGALNRAFNKMVESISEREKMEASYRDSSGDENGSAWRNAPSRVTLHRMVSRLRSRISDLDEATRGTDSGGHRELVNELDQLSQAVARMTEFGFPLDLSLERTDVRETLYEVVLRFREELAARAVSVEVEVEPGVDYAVVDRLKLREAVSELVRNALAALPERGGHVGLRSRIAQDGSELLLEVADDGAGANQSLIDRAFDPDGAIHNERPRTGLTLARAIVEQHGGRLKIESEPRQGTYARIQLPLHT